MKASVTEKEHIRTKLEIKRLKDPQWRQKFRQDLFKQAEVKVHDEDLKDIFKRLEK
ncbi:hypothetical protein [Bacillus sp. CDB3]|uniref:hypothetical protein n=1 Tax=Bacillus sp. CDB3 TaxID=360310 RepID=UPI0021183CDD|nr:hypothetical protein [Bacillus sp. CDB3]